MLAGRVIDTVVTWLIVLTILGAGTHVVSKSLSSTLLASERHCLSLAFAFLSMNTAILANNVLVWLLLLKLKVVTPFWMIWQLVYLLSEVAILRVLPVVVLVILMWAFFGKCVSGYKWSTLIMATACLLVLGANFAILLLLNKPGNV